MIAIDAKAWQAMIDHMVQAAPREGCGLLAGNDVPGFRRACDTWVPMDNVAEFPRVRYEMDPLALLAAWERLETAGRRPWIVCHSHPHDTTAPSVHDVRLALDETLHHAVVSLRATTPVAEVWRLRPFDPGNSMTKVRYQVIDLGFRTVGTSDLTHGVTDG